MKSLARSRWARTKRSSKSSRSSRVKKKADLRAAVAVDAVEVADETKSPRHRLTWTMNSKSRLPMNLSPTTERSNRFRRRRTRRLDRNVAAAVVVVEAEARKLARPRGAQIAKSGSMKSMMTSSIWTWTSRSTATCRFPSSVAMTVVMSRGEMIVVR